MHTLSLHDALPISSIVFLVAWTIEESGDKLTDEEKQTVNDAVSKLEEAIKSEDLNNIEEATKSLNDVLTPLSQKLYQQDSSAPEQGNDDSVNETDENTVDAEFEEVKEEETK